MTDAPFPAAHGRIDASDFQPHPLLRNPHLQTLIPALGRRIPPLAFRTVRLELPDGDFIDIARCGTGGGPVAVLVHGLTGDFEAKYMRGLSNLLIPQGWETILIQLRGGGPEPNRLPRGYHHGDTGDLRDLWRRLRAEAPQRPMFCVGWSMGANVLLKALAEEGAEAPVQGAVAVCAPFRLREIAEYMRHGAARIYQNHLIKGLKRLAARKHGPVPVPPGVDLAAALRARDFFEFDDAYTAPINGFADALDYYAQCSSAQFLSSIRRPTRILNARDDPFMPRSILPSAEQLAPAVVLELSEHGGHVGFVGAGGWGAPTYWSEGHIAKLLLQMAGATEPQPARSNHIASP